MWSIYSACRSGDELLPSALVEMTSRKSENGVQRRPQLVAHIGEEHALGAVGARRFVAGAGEFGREFFHLEARCGARPRPCGTSATLRSEAAPPRSAAGSPVPGRSTSRRATDAARSCRDWDGGAHHQDEQAAPRRQVQRRGGDRDREQEAVIGRVARDPRRTASPGTTIRRRGHAPTPRSSSNAGRRDRPLRRACLTHCASM